MSNAEIKERIIQFLLANDDLIRATVDRVPSDVAYDAIVNLIERETELNYIDILFNLDEPTFRNLYLL